MVWYAKRHKREPKALRHIRGYGLLIANCTKGRNSGISNLSNHTLIGDRHVLRFDDGGMSRKAIQWVLQGADAEEDFELKCRGHACVWDVE